MERLVQFEAVWESIAGLRRNEVLEIGAARADRSENRAWPGSC